MSKNKIISVIMPAYNAAAYIHEAAQSVLSQSYPMLELIVVNDGSSDNTEEIIGGFSDSRIRYFSQQNKGVSAARNLGLREMEGNYFCFLDADDFMPSNSLLSRLKIFESNENVDFVDGRIEVYDARLTKVVRVWKPEYQGNPLPDLLQMTGDSFFGLSWMIRRKPETSY